LDHLVALGDIAKQLKLSLSSNEHNSGLVTELQGKQASHLKKTLSNSHTLKISMLPKEVREIAVIPAYRHRQIRNKG
jgi:hypothetical protein